jgi:hypothetical protein
VGDAACIIPSSKIRGLVNTDRTTAENVVSSSGSVVASTAVLCIMIRCIFEPGSVIKGTVQRDVRGVKSGNNR